MNSEFRVQRLEVGSHHRRNEHGMNTAEYAMGTVAACGFAGLLFLCQGWYADLLRELVQTGFQEVPWWPLTGW